jgi:hypothetical protein
MRRVGLWWSGLSLGWQLLIGIVAAFALWMLWTTVGIRVAYWAWVGAWLPWHALEDSEDIQKLGQIGDLFGGVNALFAAFAFVGVAIAAYYQHRTFVLQREQDVRQSFEPLFFKLLDRHMPPTPLVVPFPSREFDPFSRLEHVEALRNALAIVWGNVATRRGAREEFNAAVISTFTEFYGANDGVLAPYFRKLYHLFKFIATSELGWEDKVRYANIARASLNKDELLLILANCCCDQGAEFKPLVEGLGLLKHIPMTVDGGPSIESLIAERLYCPTATMSSADRERYWMLNPGSRPIWARGAPEWL